MVLEKVGKAPFRVRAHQQAVIALDGLRRDGLGRAAANALSKRAAVLFDPAVLVLAAMLLCALEKLSTEMKHLTWNDVTKVMAGAANALDRTPILV